MKQNKIQVVLPDSMVEKFDFQSSKQKRSKSNLARKYIIDGLNRDEYTDLRLTEFTSGDKLA